MSTKAKIVISVIAICIILALITISIVLVFTAPTHIVDDSTFVITHRGGTAANVTVTREDINLFQSEETNSTMIDIEEKVNYSMTNAADGTTAGYDLGMFNRGQEMDMSKADTTMTIDVELSDTVSSNSVIVKLNYADMGETDTNVRMVVNATLYSANGDTILEQSVLTITDGQWNNNLVFQCPRILSYSGDNRVTIEVKSEVVSYAEKARLDGQFTLSLIGA